MFSDGVEKLNIAGHQSVTPKHQQDASLQAYLHLVTLLVHYHKVHECVAQNEQQPLPRSRCLEGVHAAKVERCVQGLALRTRSSIGKCIVDVCFSFL